jgi:hypothetical protein
MGLVGLVCDRRTGTYAWQRTAPEEALALLLGETAGGNSGLKRSTRAWGSGTGMRQREFISRLAVAAARSAGTANVDFVSI